MSGWSSVFSPDSSLALSPCPLVTLSPGHLWAAEPFPRGPGFYFDPVKLALLIVVYFCWVATCRWVDRDAEKLKLPATTWNPVMFAGGLIGLAVLWALPWFWLSFPVLLVCYLGPTLSYVNVRNRKVAPEER